jgi:tRNA-splicing ligase RtcB
MEQITKRFMNYASILEDNTREQAQRVSEMPFVYPHLALMPDAHLGKGATVGSVIPTLGAIIPAAVGVDIGCGMIAVKTDYSLADIEDFNLKNLRERIEVAVPVSAGGYNTSIYADHTQERIDRLEAKANDIGLDGQNHFAPNWALQLGTLGSGNHFIEVSVDEADHLWLFLHSGSRGVGNKIAQHHIGVAKKLMDRYFINLPDDDLAYLVEGTEEFWAYIRELRWAQDFALENRAEMMDRVVGCFEAWFGEQLGAPGDEHLQVQRLDEINCHHNYTAQEKHWGKEVWLSRKGAIDAHLGVRGLIPGSMGTRSYVVTGKGDRLALCSSPHGAGREYSRSKARRAFTHDQLREAMAGIEYRDTDAFIDEIPQAYKDIDVVMADAADLVEVQHTLRQIVNVKGD